MEVTILLKPQIVATSIFILFGIERFGRRWSLVLGLSLMAMFLWIIGAIFNTSREHCHGSMNECTNRDSP